MNKEKRFKKYITWKSKKKSLNRTNCIKPPQSLWLVVLLMKRTEIKEILNWRWNMYEIFRPPTFLIDNHMIHDQEQEDHNIEIVHQKLQCSTFLILITQNQFGQLLEAGDWLRAQGRKPIKRVISPEEKSGEMSEVSFVPAITFWEIENWW